MKTTIDAAVSKFLSWKLPEDFSPDCFITFDGDKAKQNKSQPIGTNLLTAEQARAMFKHCLAGAVEREEAQTVEPVAEVVPCYVLFGKRVALHTKYQDLPIGTELFTRPAPPPSVEQTVEPIGWLHAGTAFSLGKQRPDERARWQPVFTRSTPPPSAEPKGTQIVRTPASGEREPFKDPMGTPRNWPGANYD